MNIYAQHTVFSVIALLHASLKEMDQEFIEVLCRALTHMNEAYASGKSYSDIHNMMAIPTEAYLSTIMDK